MSGTVIPVVTCYECGTIMDHGEALGVVECGCCGLKHESDLKYRNEDHIYDITHMTGGRLFMEETGPSELRSRKMYKRRAIRQMTKTRYVFGIRAFCQLCADLANGTRLLSRAKCRLIVAKWSGRNGAVDSTLLRLVRGWETYGSEVDISRISVK